MSREPIPYYEMTDDQRRAIVEAAQKWRSQWAADPINYADRSVIDAVDAATREKPKRRRVVEFRVPRCGDAVLDMEAIDLIPGTDWATHPRWVLVEELD